MDFSDGVRNLQTASAEHTVASAGPMGCMGTGQWAAGTVHLWRWHSAERGKYQLKQHFEGARLPHVAADSSSIQLPRIDRLDAKYLYYVRIRGTKK